MSKRALVIDNDFLYVEYVEGLLEQKGYKVTKAYDGQQGVSIIKNMSFDLIVTDLFMPKIDGVHLIRFVRRKFPYNCKTIIAVSSTMVEQGDACDDIEADYYIAKGPLDYMEVKFNKVIDKIEEGPFQLPSEQSFFETRPIYPREATLELLDALHFERAIMESMMIGVIVADKDARILKANPCALYLVNQSCEDLLNSHLTIIFPEKERQKLMSELEMLAHSNETKRKSFSLLFHSKEIRIIVSPLVVEGKMEGWVIVMDGEDQAPQQAGVWEEDEDASLSSVGLPYMTRSW